MIPLTYLLTINVITFFLFGADKSMARAGNNRIPERTLLLLSLAGGGIGGLAGMKIFRHKTKKSLFYIGVPFALLANALLTGLVYIAIKYMD